MTGIDLVKISRIALAAKRGAFLQRAFTDKERAYYLEKGEKIETLAGMYAAKEAVVKALGTGFKSIRPDDIDIIHDENGAPRAVLSQIAAQKTGVSKMEVSITHEGDFAFAVAGPECGKITKSAREELRYAATCCNEPELWQRQLISHKGDYGRIYVIGGSAEMTGAPLMCVLAALKAGAGLVTLCVPRSLAAVYQQKTLQNTLLFMPDNEGKIIFDSAVLDEICSRADAVVIGMGMGKNAEAGKIIEYLMQKDITLIVDADGLNAMAADIDRFAVPHACRLILTPHIGEFLRLQPDSDFLSLARRLSCVVMKKSAVTEITDGYKTTATAYGTPTLSKGGSGDILAGITAAMTARLEPFEACIKASYILGRAAKTAEETLGENSPTAEDILKNIQ